MGDGTFTNLGSLLITADGTVIAAGAGYNNVSNNGYLGKTAGSGVSTIAANVINSGTVDADSGTLTLASAAGTGVFQIDDSCVLDIAGGVGSGTMQFMGNAGTLTLETPAGFAGVIAGFGGGSVIDLFGVTTAATLSFTASGSGGGTLAVSDGSMAASIAFANDLTSHSFGIVSDGHGGVLIS
jgi:hypothetical protein